MQQACSYRIPDTHLQVNIITSFTSLNQQSIAEKYGLIHQTRSDVDSTGHDILVTANDQDPGLPEELTLLDPLEAILCGQDIYVNDGRVSLGPPIYVESRSPSALPQIALDVALTLCFAQQGAITLHACGFRFQGMDFLALGPTKSGKSTLAGAVLSAGGRVLTDDQLICHMRGGSPHVRWLRKGLLLREGGLDALSQPLKENAKPVQVSGEQRWSIDRSRLEQCFVDELTPCTLLYLRPPRPETAPRPQSIPTLTPISHGQAFAQLISASSPALFSKSAVAIPGLSAVCRSLLAATTHYQLTTSYKLVSNPREELSHLVDCITANPLHPGPT